MFGLRSLTRRLFDRHLHLMMGLAFVFLVVPAASAQAQDINGDGRVDAVFTQKQRYNQVCFGNGSGAFTNCVDLIGAGQYTLSNQINTTDAALVDFDEDGDLDIALAMEGHSNVVCYNAGGGDFNSGWGCIPTTGFNGFPYNAQEVVAADIDADGHQDLIYANGGNAGLPLSQPNVLCWGFGSLGVACYEFGTDAPSTGLAVGDFDGDGDKDVIVSNRGAANEVCLFNGRLQNGVNFDCRPMPASVYDEYSYINGTWVLQTKTVNPIPPTLSNAVAVGRIDYGGTGQDALLDVAFANDGTNVVCLGNGNWTGTNVGFTCREMPEATSYGATTATARSMDVVIGEVSPSWAGEEILFANAEVGNVMCTRGVQCLFAFHPNLPAHQVWWAAGNQYQMSSNEPDHQPATGIAIRDINFLQAGTSGRYPIDVVVATVGTSRSFMRADCCTTSSFVTANDTLNPTSVTLSGGTVGAPVDGPPSFFGANNVTVEATGPSGAVATFTVTAIDNEDGARPVSCSPASGSTFGLGNTTVTCSSSDTTNHTGTTTLMVTVRDTTGPVITVPGNLVLTAPAGQVTGAAAFTVTAHDAVDGVITSVTCFDENSNYIAPGQQISSGVRNLTCSAYDSRKNSGQASFSITMFTDIDNDGTLDNVDTDDDGDGIVDTIDTTSTVSSSAYEFSASNTGTVTRNGWTVTIAPTTAGSYSLRASLSGAGTAPAVITASCGGVSKQLRLDATGETIEWRCEAQAPSLLPRTLAVKFISGTPEFWKMACGLDYPGPGACGYIKITGAVNNAVSAGSPVTADPSNTEPIEVTIYNSAGTAIGSITLQPGEAVDVQEVADPNGGANLLQLELINGGTDGQVTVTLFNQPQTLQMGNGPATFSTVQTVFASGTAAVTAWDPIFPTFAYPYWPSLCTAAPAVGLNANWVNPHAAFSFPLGSHPWEDDPPYNFSANWINAWSTLNSKGPGGHSWTKYSTAVTGEGEFVVQFLADNCSWIYLDGQLVGVQDNNWQTNGTGRYPVTLTGSGPHTLSFIILDGGGAAGGKFRLETRQSFIDNGGDPDDLPEKAPSTTTVTFGDGPFIYTGSPFVATSSVSPDGTANIVYSGDCVNAGNTCTATATFEGSATHFASTATTTITIAPAPTTTSVSFGAPSFIYSGATIEATASAGATIVYSGSCTNVGTCTATATTAGDANHIGSSAVASAAIIPAPTTTTVSFGAGPFIYNGSAFTATASSSFGTPAIVYTGSCTNVGTCTATATNPGDANHEASSATATAEITKAPTTTTVSFGAGPFVYNGSAFTAAASSSFGTPAVAYSGDCTNAGSSCTATATYAGDTNHTGSSASASITTDRAVATVTATPYVVEYDGQPHSATFTIAGVNGETGAAVGAVTHNTTHTNVGTYNDSWSFAGANYVSIGATPITNRIKDTTSPVIGSISNNAPSLWPPNHKMVAVTVTASASDLAGVTSLKIINVTSSEPDNGLGDGDTAGDIVITGAMTVNLRAERSGKGNGRTYTITVEARDAAGNATTRTTTVVVPNSQGK